MSKHSLEENGVHTNGKKARSAFDLQSLVRPNIWALEPYRCARDDYDKGVLLDANENSLGAPVTYLEGYPTELERYPDPYQKDLKALIADFRGVQPENIFIGVGSDEAIDLLIRIFCRPGVDSIVINPPTYGMYKVAAATNDVGVISIPLNSDFQLEPAKINQVTHDNDKAKLLFVCTPNNPSSNELRYEDIIAVIEGSSNAIVVVDEAYVDFGENGSMAPLVNTYPNLVVMQTMSKSFGLAGIRLGMSFGSPQLIEVMNKVKAPYNMNKLTSAVALRAYAKEGLASVLSNVNLIKQERDWLMAQIATVPGVKKVFKSSANFFLAQMDDAQAIYKEVADAGVVTRYRGNELHCDGCLRITVGTREQNNELLAKLTQSLAKRL